ncbi:DUF973 family protein [Sulfuracidifex tepidarius]|uniref:DUF973 family protein n=1 Tax=Sulfuracidifex tepidarius TaxID=1294262 RepID=A0A510DXK4_9CREN|nr:DUF973 family protein [Sulfuracidifex tepidarius]BBG24937.1 hypothetical protein IC006_2271 [Sulfuracidifex tepidarius]BBG27721.1 hypothetical protein IC007_2275 [Sulfuracidifex tepidarius]
MNGELRNGFSNVGIGSLLSAIGLTLMEVLSSIIPFSSLLGLVLGIIGLYFLIKGFGSLKRGGISVSNTGFYLISIGVILDIVLVVLLYLFLGSLGLSPTSLVGLSRHTVLSLLPYIAGIGIVSLVSLLLFLVGGILAGISFYNLGKSYGNSPMQVGGILVAIPFLEFIGYFLTWVGTMEVGKSPIGLYPYQQQTYVQTPTPSYPTPSYPVPYQIGAGTIDSTGRAFLTLFSQVQVQITDAQLLDSNIVISQTRSFTPTLLVPGNNNVNVNFTSFQGNPGRAYIVRLFLSGGTYVDALVKYLG